MKNHATHFLKPLIFWFKIQFPKILVFAAAIFLSQTAFAQTTTDCDGDGILNLVDLDDDNDGVLDSQEQGCGTTGAWTLASAGVWVSNISPNLKVRVTFANASGSGAWSVAGTPIANFARNCFEYTSEYTPIVNVNKPALQFTKSTGSSVGSFKVEYLDASNNPVLMPNARMHLGGLGGSFGTGQIGSSSWKLQGGKTMTTLSADAVDFGTTSDSIFHKRLFLAGSGVNDCATGEGSATLAINGSNSSFTYNVKMFGNTIDQMIVMFEGCDQLDTDGDGVLNVCDLDSDGDGCSDAFESGATISQAPNYSFPLPINTQGVSDAVPASYTSTYANALNSTIHTCAIATPDTVTVTPACPTCPTTSVCPTADDLPPTGAITYQNCGLNPAEIAVGSMAVDGNGCIIWTPNGTQTTTVTTCVVKCVAGLCDTTFVIIPPPITVDTVSQTININSTTTSLCPDISEVAGPHTFELCAGTGAELGTLSVFNTTTGCFTYTSGAVGGFDDFCVKITGAGGAEDTTFFKITITQPTPKIGTAKMLKSLTENGDGTFTATYMVFVENKGTVPIYDVQLTDNLAAEFGSNVSSTPTAAGTYQISSAPSVVNATGSTVSTANAAFNGASNDKLVNPTAGQNIAVDGKFTVQFAVKFYPAIGKTSFANSATASGDGSENGMPDGQTTDQSVASGSPSGPGGGGLTGSCGGSASGAGTTSTPSGLVSGIDFGMTSDPNCDGSPSEQAPVSFTISPTCKVSAGKIGY